MAIMSTKSYRGVRGFSLLEMSVVLLIIGVIVGSGVEMLPGVMQNHMAQETAAREQAIQTALLNYRVAFNRLPCPAGVTVATTDINFGVAAANPGSCRLGTPTAEFTPISVVVTGDTTTGSTTILNVSSTAGLSVGWLV